MTDSYQPDTLFFTVLGRAQPAGSKRAFAIRKGGVLTGKVAVTDAAKGSRSWKQEVRSAAFNAAEASGWKMKRGPLRLSVVFLFTRPASHFGSGKNADTVKASAPNYPAVKPDATKLVRAVEDALTGLIWLDDAQIIDQDVTKRYGEKDSCMIWVQEMPSPA
jgi:Holliday junction resolvase RusA-like endonuclease